MTLSDIDICNQALGHLGRTADRIQSFTERSTSAATCAIWYESCRREVLETHDWSFARKRLTLALHADAPPVEWRFRYQAPSDLIALRSFWNPFSNRFVPACFTNNWPGFGGDMTDAIPYEFEVSLDGQQKTLLTNQDLAVVRYTFDQIMVQMFSPLFVNALAHYMAAKMAVGITGKVANKKEQEDEFRGALRSAAGSDANQRTEPPPRDASSVRSRW